MLSSSKTYGPGDKGLRETTEWEDILVKRDIIREDEHIKERREALERAKQRTEVPDDTFEERAGMAKTKRELDALEDDAKMDDDELVLVKLRLARIEQLRKESVLNRFGSVERIGRDEFIPQVKQYSATGGLEGGPVWVVIELMQDKLERSRLFSDLVNRLAKANPSTRFVRMVADHCIENWPDSNVPSVFAYYEGELKHQVIGPVACQGIVTSLVKAGAITRVLSKDDSDSGGEDDEEVDVKGDSRKHAKGFYFSAVDRKGSLNGTPQ